MKKVLASLLISTSLVSPALAGDGSCERVTGINLNQQGTRMESILTGGSFGALAQEYLRKGCVLVANDMRRGATPIVSTYKLCNSMIQYIEGEITNNESKVIIGRLADSECKPFHEYPPNAWSEQDSGVPQ